MVVAFCGHKDIFDTDSIKSRLTTIITELISKGADTFYLGGYGTFDTLAASVVHNLKKTYPNIRSVLVIPYLNRDYETSIYDETLYPSLEAVPLKFAISRRNEWTVDHSDVIVSYVLHDWGGAASTLAYARRRKKRIIYANEYY